MRRKGHTLEVDQDAMEQTTKEHKFEQQIYHIQLKYAKQMYHISYSFLNRSVGVIFYWLLSAALKIQRPR